MTELRKFCEAIARMEGWYKPGSLSQRNNNPGNIRKFETITVNGEKKTLVGFQKYNSPQEGWAALEKLVKRYLTGTLSVYQSLKWKELWKDRAVKSPTLYEFFQVYAPDSDGNNSKKYAEFVAKETGLPLNLPLAPLVKY